ncbi:MAG: redoxin domain-containing protein [Gammaproteobacteria bacterium]|nr:redoxin domain-containing protein [Gammaproteobacteria bacterium]
MWVILTPAAGAHAPGAVAQRLPTLGAAPEFRLTTQEGAALALADLRGKVVVVSFLYTACADTCPLLTAKLVGIQRALGDAFGEDVFFLSVSVDPENDRPDVLKRYAQALGCDLSGWAFLTGSAEQIRQTSRDYGVYQESNPGGDVDHNLLTSLVDRQGFLRVQYMGDQFDPGEFLHDLERLAAPVRSP